jgi:hypothetical protein
MLQCQMLLEREWLEKLDHWWWVGGGRVTGVVKIIGGHGLTYQAAPLERWAAPDEPGAWSLACWKGLPIVSLSGPRFALELSAA